MEKRTTGAMHVVRIVSQHGDREYVSHLLRQSYREGGKVKNRTLANLSALPPPAIDAIRRSLAGEVLVPFGEAFSIERSWPHGQVAAVVGTARKLGLEALVDGRPSRPRDLVLAMVAARVLQPASKLATTRLWSTTSLGSVLGVEEASEDELYAAMDWLLARQEGIEQRLAKRYLQPGGVVLYDLSSTYVEGERCPLAKRGYSRDGKPGSAQATKLQEVAGAGWITALRAPAIKQLVEAGSIQLSLFDTQDLAEVTDPRYPGERLVVCYNPLLAQKRARKRAELLLATEKELQIGRAHV